MHSSKKAILTVLVFILSVSPLMVQGGQNALPADAIYSDRIVFKCKDNLVPAGIEPAGLLALLGPLVQKRGLIRLEKLEKTARGANSPKAALRMGRIFRGYLSASANWGNILAWLKRHPLIEYAEPLYYHAIDALPDDSLFTQQTYLQVIGLPAAWDVVKGSQGGAIMAIIDGGTDIRHQDLRDNLWVNDDEIAGNAVDDDGNGYADDLNGWNFANGSGDPTGLATQPAYGNHGTHTAGIANAATNNTHGVAGAAWNCRLMAINAADPFGEGIGYGYDAILYAAENGAKIINCSWGRTGAASVYEQDVINYATSLGAVIVASAGNSGSTTLNYPACYPNVFSVAATNNWDAKASFSTYGYWIDVSAPGVDIFSTISSNSYARYSGTSMSAPLAAGVIALVKTKNPGWSGFQCAEQVRVTSNPIDNLNPAYAEMIGKGRVDANKAVTASSPSIRLTAVGFSGDDGDSQFRPGETARIYATLTNYLAPSSPISLSLSENSAYATLLNNQVTLPGLATLESAAQTTPFEVLISEQAPAGHVVTFSLKIVAGDYSDNDRFTLTVSHNFVNLSINQILTSATPIGRIGFANPSEASGGSGFVYKSGTNLIYEGSIIAGTSSAQISSTARSMTTMPDQDFTMIGEAPLTLLRPGGITDEESTVSLQDQNTAAPMNISLKQHSFASNDAAYEDFIIFRYEVTNQGTQTLANFHFALFFDWDVDAEHFDVNIADYDASRSLGYVHNPMSEPGTYVGCALLSPGAVSCRAILNDEQAIGNPGWGIYDGFSDAEKWEAISGGVTISHAGIGDVSQVLSAGPYQIDPQGTVTIDFALIAGDNLTQLQKHADKAMEFRDSYLVAEPDSALIHLKGWNLVSSWVAPADSLLENLLAPIAGQLILFKDGLGSVYWPAYQIAMVKYWDWRKGYWIYVAAPADLLLAGQLVTVEKASLELKQGWNLISCLRESAIATEEALSSITDAVILAKDGMGRVYWPAYGINTIGEMQPGLGYYLYLTSPATLEWPEAGP